MASDGRLFDEVTTGRQILEFVVALRVRWFRVDEHVVNSAPVEDVVPTILVQRNIDAIERRIVDR